MNVQVIRSRRKTISLSITPDGEVLVRAPYHCSNAYIQSFVQSKQSWLDQHLPQMRACQQARAAYALQPGMTLPVLGEERPVVAATDGSLAYQGGAWSIPDLPFAQLKPQIQGIYKSLGRAYLPEVVARYARQMRVSYGRITVNSANRRWASCSANGNLNFSWRLVMAPPEDIAYVVMHELAHRRYFNHSPEFWAFVAQFCPDYPQRKASLQQLHQRLLRDNWV